MRFDIMTLFPEVVEGVLKSSITGRAIQKGIFELYCHNIRDYSADKWHRVDDAPYGGGAGMVMAPQPICDCFAAVCAALPARPHVIYLSPKGKVLTQEKAKELSTRPYLALLCGHYEGIDERALELIVDEELSIGDYVLTGGEIPAMVLVDCVSRMLPGVLASEEGYTEESHYNSLLEYPQYTRPELFEGKAVPEVLLSGHHKKIAAWRREQQLLQTFFKRPDLLKKAELTKKEQQWLADVQAKQNE